MFDFFNGILKKIKNNIYSNSSAPKKNGNVKFFRNSVEIESVKENELIKIVPLGYFPNHPDGPHEITSEHIKQMAENLTNGGTDVLFDFGHESIWNPGAIAAGWSPRTDVEAREDGLYIKYPEFTPSAKTKVADKDFRYFSPAYVLCAKDKLGKEIGAMLHSIGLVNKPYMDTEIDHIGNSFQFKNNQGESSMNKNLLKFLGLPETATEQEIEDKLKELRAKYELEETATIEDIIKKIEDAAKQNSSTEKKETKTNSASKTVEERLAELENKDEESKINSLVDGAVQDGKILPAEKEVYLNSAKNDFNKTKSILDAKKKNSALPQQITVNGAEPIDIKNPKSIAGKAVEYLNSEKAKGNNISYAAAVKHVTMGMEVK